MANYTITLTDAEDKALGVVALNKQEWIENAVKNRCRQAKEEIVASEIKRIRESGGTVSGTDDEIVMAATVESAAEKLARMESDFT
jgi:aspartyl aminopeptidase